MLKMDIISSKLLLVNQDRQNNLLIYTHISHPYLMNNQKTQKMHGVSTILYTLNTGFCRTVISVFSINISNQADMLPQGSNYRSHYC